MANNYYSNENIHVEALFGDTNNVCICSQAYLKDFCKRPKTYDEDYYYYENGENFEEYDSYNNALKDPSEDPEMPYENEFEEDFELMKSMGLPTSFGKPRGYMKYEYCEDDYEEENENGINETGFEGVDQNDYDYYSDSHNNDSLETGESKNSICPTSNLEINSDFEDFWALHGKTIILNSWIQKYKDYISPDYQEYYDNELKMSSEKTELDDNTSESNCDSVLNNMNDKFESMSFSDQNVTEFINDGNITFVVDKSGDKKNSLGDDEPNNYESGMLSENFESMFKLKDFAMTNEFKTDQLEKFVSDIDSDSVISHENKSENNSGTKKDEVKMDAILDVKCFYEELERLKEKNPELFQKRCPNNMFSCTVPEGSDENVASAETISDKTWEELWTVHCREQYERHFTLFSESNEKRNIGKSSIEPSETENDTLEALKCNLCGEYNCDFCISDDYEKCDNGYNSDTNDSLFNTFIFPGLFKRDGDFYNDHNTILAYPLIRDNSVTVENPTLPDNIFALDSDFGDSGDIQQIGNSIPQQPLVCDDVQIEEDGNNDDEPPTELPIKRMHEEEFENEEPEDLIKELGLVIKPTNALKAKRNKRRRIHKSYKKYVKHFVDEIQDDDQNASMDINKVSESNEANLCSHEPNETSMQVPEDAESTPVLNSEEVAVVEFSENINSEIENDPVFHKYWYQRYRLFYRFDEGIILDKESWFSVTPERIAQHIAERCACPVMIDAFCGAGGNAIQFAFTCSHVIAIDIDPKRVEIAKHNATVYGVADKIDFIVGDYLALAPSLKADGVFLSPPWGGPEYARNAEYDIAKIEPNIYETFEITRKITQNIALFVPKNTIINQLVTLSGDGNSVEVEQNFLNKKVKTLTAYYGSFVNNLSEGDSKEDCESL